MYFGTLITKFVEEMGGKCSQKIAYWVIDAVRPQWDDFLLIIPFWRNRLNLHGLFQPTCYNTESYGESKPELGASETTE